MPLFHGDAYSRNQKGNLIIKLLNDDTFSFMAQLQEKQRTVYTLSCSLLHSKESSEHNQSVTSESFVVTEWKKNVSV